MERDIFDMKNLQNIEAVLRNKFNETLNPCFLILASSYTDIIEAKKYNIEFKEKEDEISL